MYRPNEQEFLRALLEALDDLPPEFARRLEEVLAKEHVDRSQAIRQLFEEVAGEAEAQDAEVPAPRHARSALSMSKGASDRAGVPGGAPPRHE
jgi:predicted anti-sigma-YlaC factor YlaD